MHCYESSAHTEHSIGNPDLAKKLSTIGDTKTNFAQLDIVSKRGKTAISLVEA